MVKECEHIVVVFSSSFIFSGNSLLWSVALLVAYFCLKRSYLALLGEELYITAFQEMFCVEIVFFFFLNREVTGIF